MQFSIYLSRKQKIYTVFCHKLILIKIYIVCDHILRYTKLKNFLNLLRIAPHSLANEKKILQHQSELFTESSCSVLGGISGPMIICSGVPSPPSRIGSCSGGSPIPERDIQIHFISRLLLPNPRFFKYPEVYYPQIRTVQRDNAMLRCFVEHF